MKLFFARTARALVAAGALALSSANVLAAEDSTVQMLRALADAPGPSGAEEAVRAIMVQYMKPLADKVSFDGLGSVIAQQGSSGPRIMIAAHMDEVGGMIRRTTADGFITMQMLGGWLDQALIGQRWIIFGSKGPVHAVTGIPDIHLVPAGERTPIPRDGVFLDVGAKSAAEVQALGIEPGDPVVPDAPFLEMNGTGNYVGKAWDDRIGCAVMIEAMRRSAKAGHANQLFFVATVREEINSAGAQTSAAIIKPDVGIVIEGGVVSDTPGAKPETSQVKMGGGPGLFLYDRTGLPNRRFVDFVKETARQVKSPLQLDLVQIYEEDSEMIQKSGGGTPTVNIVVPVRYTHAHNGIVNRDDFDRTVDLLVGLLSRLDAAKVAHLRDFAP